jgi:hypothetical protein
MLCAHLECAMYSRHFGRVAATEQLNVADTEQLPRVFEDGLIAVHVRHALKSLLVKVVSRCTYDVHVPITYFTTPYHIHDREVRIRILDHL